MSIKIAIDGPSGAGKSSISKMLARDLGFTHIDTGAMYRAITLYLLENNINIEEEKEVNNSLSNIDIKIKDEKIYLNGKDVSKEIRENNVTRNVSLVSSYKKVRDKLVLLQRDLANYANSILDGRDIGTNVLKDADIKIFLTASLEKRAKRRYLENREKGIETNLEDLIKEIEKRDYADSNRDISPLKMAEDAILVDTTDLNQEEVVEEIKRIMEDNNAL